MASVKLGRWVLYYVCESPHRDGKTRMCVCVFVCSTLWSSPVSCEFAGKI